MEKYITNVPKQKKEELHNFPKRINESLYFTFYISWVQSDNMLSCQGCQEDLMFQFRRAIRLFLFLLGAFAGIIATIALYFTRFILRPPRKSLWATPRHFGLAYEDVQFPAHDGVRLSGWFIPVANDTTPRPTIILIHGWPWNRLGTIAGNLLEDIPGTSPIELLILAYTLHTAGYHILMFDLRNHGQSATSPPVTFGFHESNDLLGAVEYLQTRSDVDKTRLGAIGFSMGANTILFALPRTNAIKAAVAVQPTTPTIFNQRYAAYLLGPLGIPLSVLMNIGYTFISKGLHMSAINPIFAAAAGRTPILYIQGTGDAWGSVEDVAQMVVNTPRAIQPIYPRTTHRFEGYQYLLDHPDIALLFFNEHLNE